MSLKRRTERLEEQTSTEAGEPIVFEIHYTCPAPGGGTLVEVHPMPPPHVDAQDYPRRYYFETEEGEHRKLTKKEYEAALPASYALSEHHPDHQPRKTL